MFLCSLSGHCTTLTTALSSVFPPLSFLLGMMISWMKFESWGTRKAISFSTRSFPTIWSCARFTISMTIASLICLSRRAIYDTFTLSPSIADIELRSATNTGVPPSLGMNELRPLALRRNVPSCTCVFMFRRYEFSLTFERKSSHAISSITSMASILRGWVSNLRALKICLNENVSFGLCWKRF